MTESMSASEFVASHGRRSGATKRVLAGGSAARIGSRFEKDLEATHTVYDIRGNAKIWRVPVNTAPLPPKALADKSYMGRARVLSEPAPFDYVGVLANGVACGIEAKANQEEKTSLPISGALTKTGKKQQSRGGVRLHQLEACVEIAWQGGIGIIVWRHGNRRGVLMPDRVREAMELYRLGNRKSIPWSAFTEYRWRRDLEGRVLEDWLTPVLEWHGKQPAGGAS
ncbi:MAG: hypothetical protein AAF108_02820 [Planctomycetota bacterium]